MSALHRSLALVLALTLAAAVGCGSPEEPVPAPRPAEPRAPPAAATVAEAPDPIRPTESAPAAAGAPRVVFLGDSLTAGLGVAADQAWPAVVAGQLAADGVAIEAVNAGVSGDTSAGGLRRLDWLLRQDPDLLVVELGANDALRGQPVAGVEENLRQIVTRARAAGVEVLLVGLQIPPSYGADYATAYSALYPRLAAELDVPLVPFLLEGVGGVSELNLADGLHPNAEGHQRLAETVRPYLERLLAP